MATGKENVPPSEPVAQGGQSAASKGKKSKVCFLSPNSHFLYIFIAQIPRESDILAGNLAKNDNISLLRG
jgi:hypothetical protein